jgi:putative FmdB family regulatory protein
MPTYEYACTRCGNRFEIFQRIEDEPLSVCEACGGPLRKVFHPAGIVFKGSGFYATDSRAKPKAEKASSRDSKKDGGKKDESKSSGSTSKEKTA